MRKLLLTILVLTVSLTVGSPAHAGGVDAQAAFERLKTLAGTWSGEYEGEETAEEAESAGEAIHEIRVSAAGTVVMETMGPGTDHEMINMYHLDGEDLVLTHYCAGGNQPMMRLDREASSSDRLEFDFAGGTNLDPAVDPHIHSAVITLIDADHVESAWESFAGGEKAGDMTFRLERSR